ncbi:MAG: 4-hydroxy-3-methylbut-2-enyl diphosphate reductase [Actinomycetota bacterium]|nr:4-hydroxy-3-methylbut-2-enyl diphosphate reductase [Actinomycetota bacterium]
MDVEKVLLAKPRGFCAGVEMAIKSLTWMVKIFEPPVYCYHEIVHNKVIVDRFERLGVRFVEDLSEIPPGAPVMLSAHGSAPELVESARKQGRISINAVCPLVTKVHHEVKVRSNKGYSIIYVGHKDHDEAIGTIAIAPNSITLIENEEELDRLQTSPGPVALVNQTTLSLDDWAEIRESAQRKFPGVWMANRSDLCFATTNRQLAVREVSNHSDVVVVIGSANSSNTVALAMTAKRYGAKEVYRINDPSELPEDISGVVAVTAGASAPEDLIEAVIAKLHPKAGIEEVNATEEEEYFPPPPELRDLLRALSAAVALSLLAPRGTESPLEDDRSVGASETLNAILARP